MSIKQERNLVLTSSVTTKPSLHVEVLLDDTCTASDHVSVKRECSKILMKLPDLIEDVVIAQFDSPELQKFVKLINVVLPETVQKVCLSAETINYHLYNVHSEGPTSLDFNDGCTDIDAASCCMLPSADLVGLWESLIFDSCIKNQLLNYVSTSLLFSQRSVDCQIIPWNKVILLHGPPGTGKTSLCKALAQKISVRFSRTYSYGYLIEINSHSLFSKWFSESGKLVSKLFASIEETVSDQSALTIVLIDEVESLAHSRKATFGSNAEPSDSIRVVNALLTHLDRIRRHPNVLIMTTSNITEAIDVALVDRADIKQYIGPPSADAIYQIFCSCIMELQRTDIIDTRGKICSLAELKTATKDGTPDGYSHALMKISKLSCGLSGRTVRKLTLVCHALHLGNTENVTMDAFLDALYKTVSEQFEKEEGLGDIPARIKEL